MTHHSNRHAFARGEGLEDLLPKREPEEVIDAVKAERSGRDLEIYARSLPAEGERATLYRSLLLLQRRFFHLASRLSFAELEPLYAAYETAYRQLEDALYSLDLAPTSTSVPPEDTTTYDVLLMDA
jgi:hypothetical protein